MKKIFLLIILFLATNVFPEAGDGYKIRLKSRIFTPQENAATLSTNNYKGHRIVQFKEKLTTAVVDQLQEQGIRVVGYVPENALALSIPENADLSAIKNIHWIGKLEVEDKISSRISKISAPQYALVDVFEDVDRSAMERRIRDRGTELINNRYLANYTFLVKGNERQLRTLAQDDAVNYIYPASKQIIDGKAVYQCPGASTTFGRILNFVTNGVGWDGEGQGAATVRYNFENSTPDVAGENAEVVAALETWSYYARIDWVQLQVSDQPIAIDISWRSGNHGDGNQNAFDGAGNVLAHCFFPSDINSEPIAGDLHFDEAETWVIGPDDPVNGSFDLYSIALHEAGHGLGLNHSDDPTAVMFASYGGPPFGDLRDDDIDGIRSLYLPFFTPRSPAPIFDPPAGTYESPLEVRLQYGPGTSMENTQLRYTLDGSEPTPYSFQIIPELGDYIFQRFSNTIRARAFTRGSPPSEVVSATYTLIQPTPQAETPVITPNGGTYVNSVTVNIDAETPFSVIRVTTDGTEPTPQSFSYGGPFPVNETSTVKAKAFVSGMTPSETAAENFNIIDQVATPNFYPQNGGVFAQPLNVVIDCETIDATIRYTEDGSEPNENSQIYTNPVFVGETKTISAKAFLADAIPSGVRSATFIIASQTSAPVIDPNGGTFVNSVDVTMSSTLPGATIRYTTNGSDPTSFSTEYTAPFTLGVGAHTVKAQAFLQGADPGPIAEALFNVFTASINQVETPTMNPFSGQQFVTNFPVTMDCRTEEAVIRYTVGFDQLPPDPTETGAGSITYNGPFQFGAPGFTYFFKVQAYK
ncbi:matrixin family metalloprotease, partial [candidate division KSB1 bacterium]|nr:matrixin family metalloprotease [candidate division KSB1 bacterium]